MRYSEIKPLSEIKITPKTLEKFAQGKAAEGIKVGFEAELILTQTGLQGKEIPDYSKNKLLNPEAGVSWNKIIDFFSTATGSVRTPRSLVQKKVDALKLLYKSWFVDKIESDFAFHEYRKVFDEVIRNNELREKTTHNLLKSQGLSDEQIKLAHQSYQNWKNDGSDNLNVEQNDLANRYLQARRDALVELENVIEDAISTKNELYQRVKKKFTESYYEQYDAPDFLTHFLETKRIVDMKSAANILDLPWPYLTHSGNLDSALGFSNANAATIADSLREYLGVKVDFSGAYHGIPRIKDTWIIEPDSSIKDYAPNELPCEIVSPPMPLQSCLAILPKFFDWVKECGGKSNPSTGFHINVSLPVMNIDLVKFAVFLGDKQILSLFRRLSNDFTQSFVEKLASQNTENINQAISALRDGYYQSIQQALIQFDFGKYFSINPRKDYVEIRSAGHAYDAAKDGQPTAAAAPNYFDDVKKLNFVLLRVAKAMTIANDPNAAQEEYAKKLYKILQPAVPSNYMSTLISQYFSKKLNISTFKKLWASEVVREKTAGKVLEGYKLVKKTNPTQAVAYFPGTIWPEARIEALIFINDNNLKQTDYDLRTMDITDFIDREQMTNRTAKAIDIMRKRN